MQVPYDEQPDVPKYCFWFILDNIQDYTRKNRSIKSHELPNEYYRDSGSPENKDLSAISYGL